MRLSTSYSLLKFDSKIAAALLHKQSVALMEDAIKSWVVTAEALIPVWSGASRGTLIKVGNLVGYNVSAGIQPTASALARVGDRTSQGEQSSNAKFNKSRGNYSFVYSTSLAHLIFNESNDANSSGFKLRTPGPYKFREQADAAFQATLTKGLKSFPFRLILGKAFTTRNKRTG